MNHKKISSRYFQKGFSLIEMIVVTALVGMVGVMISVTFFNITKGIVKSEIVKEVKQKYI